jgi:hypothetical protein
LNGSSPCTQAFITHQLVKEARVQQMQDGVFDTTHILINRQPVLGGSALSTMALVLCGEA